jgi:hypothetical protein
MSVADCPEVVPREASARHEGERCAHTAEHGGCCETAAAPGEKHGFMWWPRGRGPAERG